MSSSREMNSAPPLNPVLQSIEQARERIQRFPFLEWVQDQSVEPRYRLGFAPCLAPMAMGFSDLMSMGLRNLSATDRIQRILNAHTTVDDRHWQYFIHDLNVLGVNETLPLSDALRLLWGEHCTKARHLIYTSMAMVREASPILRMVILEVIEVAADAGFRPFREVGVEFTQQTGQPLYYFGQPHQDLEDEHEAMGDESIRSTIAAHPWTPAEQQQALKYVEEVTALFHDFGLELQAYAMRAIKEGPFWPLRPAQAKAG